MQPGFGASVPGMRSRKYLVLAALTIVALSCVLVWCFRDQRTQDQKIRAMQSTIETLEASLKEKEDELKKTQPHSRVSEKAQLHQPDNRGEPETPGTTAGSYQVLKELEDDSATDPRSYAEKLQELLADNPTAEDAAIACRFIFNKADDRAGPARLCAAGDLCQSNRSGSEKGDRAGAVAARQ